MLPRFKMKSPKECSAINMVSIASATKAKLTARIQKALAENGVSPRANEKHMKRKYGNAFLNIL